MPFIDLLANPWSLIGGTLLSVAAVLTLVRQFGRQPNARQQQAAKALQAACRPYARRFVYSIALAWAVGLFVTAANQYASAGASYTFLTRMFGLSALGMLFVVLTPGLIKVFFPQFRWNGVLVDARRALGLSAFFFMSLHAVLGFTRNLGGKFSAFTFLSPRHQAALILSSTALCIFLLLAVTSFDGAIRKLTFPKWKWLHRLIYPATLFVLFHAVLIGSHFVDMAAALPLAVVYTAVIFIALEVLATYLMLQRTKKQYTQQKLSLAHAGLAVLLMGALMTGVYGLGQAYNPHAGHTITYSRDYSVSVATNPADPPHDIPVELTLQVTNNRTKQPVEKFDIVQEKLMHLIVISADMAHFDHLHPEHMGGGQFKVTAMLPRAATYQLYAEFMPSGDIEALALAEVKTANAPANEKATLYVTAKEQVIGDYAVALNMPSRIKTGQNVKLGFRVTDAAGKAIKDIEPYLGAFGHLAMIHETREPYVHVHPIRAAKSPSDRFGPEIGFETIFQTPGRYKLFFQFQHTGELQVFDYVIEVES